MIFYFSGTGNTRKLVQTIAQKTNDANVVDISDVDENAAHDYALRDNERLGFAFPVYFGTCPEIFTRFISHLQIKTAAGYYAYIATSSGQMPAAAADIVKRKLLNIGLTTTAIFEWKTFDTFLPFITPPQGKQKEQLQLKSQIDADYIAQQILCRIEGDTRKTVPFARLASYLEQPLRLILQKTHRFHTTDACVACGLCARNCPVHCIRMDEKSHRPVWVKDDCELCFRCLHKCPKSAIEFGNWTAGKERGMP